MSDALLVHVAIHWQSQPYLFELALPAMGQGSVFQFFDDGFGSRLGEGQTFKCCLDLANLKLTRWPVTPKNGFYRRLGFEA